MASILQNHYVLAVHDLELSSTFFRQLGFSVVMEPPGWIFVRKNDCMIMLGECRDALPARELGDHSYIGYLRVDDVDGYEREIKGNGIAVTSAIADKPWGMREFSVTSPEGHRLTIGQIIEKRR